MTVLERLTALRKLMNERGMAAYIIPSQDFHGSEYVGEFFKTREFISGFTGSAGTVVVTADNAFLWTDGRYFLQAAEQLEGSGIELMKMGEQDVPEIETYLADSLPEGAVIGFDGRTVSCRFAEILREKTAAKGMKLCGREDLAEKIWSGRPEISKEKVWELEGALCEERSIKLAKIRAEMAKENCTLMLVSSLEEIAWLLNLRGNDVESTPVFLAYMLISPENALLFAHEEIFTPEIAEKLAKDGIEIKPYLQINEAVRAMCADKRVWADKRQANFSLMEDLKEAEYIIKKPTPMELMKAVKSPAEQAGMRRAHVRDGVAMTHFIYWLKTHVGKEKITEISAAGKLLEFRKAQEGFIEASFDTICGYAEHGAIVHYSATAETDKPLEPVGICLVDSGGHYTDGSTDITRTLVLGELTDEEKRAFTLVMKGHLNLSAAKFKYGCGGGALDYLARQPLWKEGLDYNHGTGHGVGFILSVHEGPQRINAKGSDILNPLEEGMVTSNEPGFYLAGKFGIRHENLVLCVEAERNEYGRFMRFENLTMVPFDKEGLELSLLSKEEIELFNAYHRQVWDTLSPYFEDEKEKEWLRKATSDIQ